MGDEQQGLSQQQLEVLALLFTGQKQVDDGVADIMLYSRYGEYMKYCA